MTTKQEILSAIRKHCLNCCAGSFKEVEDCSTLLSPHKEAHCLLYPYRLGSDPNPNKSKVEAGKKHGFQTKES